MTFFIVDLVVRQANFLNQQSIDQAQNLSETFAANSTSWVLANDVVGLEEVVNSQARYHDLRYAMVHDLKGKVLSHTDRSYVGKFVSDSVSINLLNQTAGTTILVNNGNLIDVGAPVMANDRQIGWVRVGIDRKNISDNLAVIVRDGIFYTLGAITAGAILAYFMGVELSRGIYRLMNVADKVSHGAHDARADVERNDELGNLARDFNRMLDALDAARKNITLSERRAHDFADVSSDWFWETDADLRYTFISDRFEEITGMANESVIGARRWDFAIPLEAEELWKKHQENLIAQRPFRNFEYSAIPPDGEKMCFSASGVPFYDDAGVFLGYRGSTSNITERRKQEEIIRHEQKMDALGQLTGGIAHDFNNMLGVILGYSELLQQHLKSNSLQSTDEEHRLDIYNDEVLSAGRRAKKLTSQLLEFSRIAPSYAEVTEINSLLSGLQHMLQTTLTPRIQLVYNLESHPWSVFIDKARLEDCILNISINAMHAVAARGTLTISTRNTHLTSEDVADMDIEPGDYVVMAFQDTGCGMTLDVQKRMFDPFFTTKGIQGTGLGLSQVYGFVQQAKGGVSVNSELGVGTVIRIYIPRHDKDIEHNATENAAGLSMTVSGQGVILLVDDEVALRNLTKEILTRHGYKVLCAESGEEALEVLKNNTVNLMLSDVIMPGMDGYQLVREVEKKYPNVIIQMISGYIDERNNELINQRLHKQRLLKPLSMAALLERVRSLLDVKSEA